jgi:addiction module RelE/StbE family toxin
MEVAFHKQFKKKLEKLPRKIRDQFYDRLELFIKNQNHKILHNHSVDKAFSNCRSINVTGDYRAIFEENQNTVTFIIIGTHSELY